MADGTSGETATWRPDLPPSSGSPVRAVVVGVALGLVGPALALVMIDGAAWLSLELGLSFEVYLVLALLGGQYVAFGGLALGYLRYRGLDWAGVRSYLGVAWPGIRGFLVVLGGWALIFGLAIVISVIAQLVGADPAQNQTVEQVRQLPQLVLLLVPVMFLVVGPCEEILYRGVVQGRLREALGPVPAILIASGVFAAVHVGALTGGLDARLQTIAILFLPSLVFGAVYEYTKNLVVPVLLHGLHNSVILLLVYVVSVYGPEGELEGGTSALVAAVPL